jgi:hypothetical protein
VKNLGRIFVLAIVVNALAIQAAGATLKRSWTLAAGDASSLAVSNSHVAAYRSGGNLKVINWAGMVVLTMSGVKQAKFISNSLWVVRVQTNGNTIEEWRVSTNQRIRSFYAGTSASLGTRFGDNLYFIADSGIYKRSISKNQVLDKRVIADEYLRDDSVVTNGKSVYFAASHEIFGLKSGDMDLGWRSYCDLKPAFIDSQGILCTGGLKFGIGSLGFDGRLQWSLPRSGTKTDSIVTLWPLQERWCLPEVSISFRAE